MILAENPLNASELIFPTLECMHIVGFAILVGSVSIVDFRMLGLGMTRQSPGELYKSLAPWTLFGLVIMLFSGPLMFSSDPDMYYLNWAFLIKMGFLLAAIVFHFTIRRKAIRSWTSPGQGKFIASLSLFLWAAVVLGGIFIGFISEGL